MLSRENGPRFYCAVLAAGILLLYLELSGRIAGNLFYSGLECLCGVTAGFGLAELWRQEHCSRREKMVLYFLLAVHIFMPWLWIPFAAGRFGGNGRHRLARSLVLLILPGAVLTGFWVLFQVLFPAEPDPAAWYWAMPPVLPVLIYLTVRRGWGLPRRASIGVLLRIICIWGLLGGTAMVLYLLVWPAKPWHLYAVWAAVLLIADGCRKYFPLPGSCRRLLGWITAAAVLPALFCIVINLNWNVRNFGTLENQEYVRSSMQKSALPVIRAAQEYRKLHGKWPADPAGLVPESYATGCFTGKDGGYRIVFQRDRTPCVWVWNAVPEGAGTWEIMAASHPLLKPGDRRYRHPFPASE